MVSDIDPKLGALVHVGMGNNVMQLLFHFVFKKFIFLFFALQKQLFVKEVQEIIAKSATRQFSHKLDHI